MMKSAFVLSACLVCGLVSAQTPDSSATTPPTATGTTKQQHFEQAKSKRLAKIGAHIDALQKVQACIQAATDFSSLHACRPAKAVGK